MPKARISQHDLSELKRSDETLRAAASEIAATESEPGDLFVSPEACEAFLKLPPLVQRAPAQPASPIAHAKRAIRAAAEAHDRDGNALRLALRVLRVVMHLLAIYARRAAAPLKRFVHSA